MGDPLTNDVIDVPAGATVEVPVYVKVIKGSKRPPGPTTLTFKATSENDATKSATSTSPVVPVT